MYKVAFALACLACTGHGWRVHIARENLQRQPQDESQVQSLAMILFAMNPAAAFHPASFAGPGVAAVHPMASARSADVSMNMLDRFGRLVKSNVNQLLNKAEDPEKVLEQAVTDMQKDLIKVRQAYAEVSASTKRIEGQIQVAEEDANKWYERAQLALEKGDETLAKEALTRRAQQQETAEGLKEQVQVQQNSVAALYESMQELENKMAEAKAKKDQIIARARTAKASTKVNDMLAGVGTSSSVAAFERMSEKVEQLEAEADVSKTMLKAMPGKGDMSMEEQFKKLEAKDSVDNELEMMKRMLPSKSVDKLPVKSLEDLEAEVSGKKAEEPVAEGSSEKKE